MINNPICLCLRFNICYDPGLIRVLKTFHIQDISAIFPSPPISADSGKLVGMLTMKFESLLIK
jgi:hypothetical protein